MKSPSPLHKAPSKKYRGAHRAASVEVRKSWRGDMLAGFLGAMAGVVLVAAGKEIPLQEMPTKPEVANQVTCHIGEFTEDIEGTKYPDTRKIDVRLAFSDLAAQTKLRQLRGVKVTAEEESPTGHITGVRTRFLKPAQPTGHSTPIISLFPKENDPEGTRMTLSVYLPGIGQVPCRDQLEMDYEGQWRYGGEIDDIRLAHGVQQAPGQ